MNDTGGKLLRMEGHVAIRKENGKRRRVHACFGNTTRLLACLLTCLFDILCSASACMFLLAFSVDIPCTLAVLLLLEREKDEMPLSLSCYSDPFDLVIHSKFRGTHTYVTLRVRRIKVERKWGKKNEVD